MRAHDYEIKTERLLLRPMTVADADAVWKWVSDERVAKYMIYPVYTDMGELREWLRSVEEFDGEYHSRYVRLSDNELIGSGSIGPSTQRRILALGYNFRYDCWKMGYATEAARAMIGLAKRIRRHTFCSSHVEPNLASGHVMEKCGLHFTRYGEFEKTGRAAGPFDGIRGHLVTQIAICKVPDAIHSPDPFHLLLCFDGFRDSLRGFHLGDDQFIAFLRKTGSRLKELAFNDEIG